MKKSEIKTDKTLLTIALSIVVFMFLLNWVSYRDTNITGSAVNGNQYDTNYYDIARTTQAECQAWWNDVGKDQYQSLDTYNPVCPWRGSGTMAVCWDWWCQKWDSTTKTWVGYGGKYNDCTYNAPEHAQAKNIGCTAYGKKIETAAPIPSFSIIVGKNAPVSDLVTATKLANYMITTDGTYAVVVLDDASSSAVGQLISIGNPCTNSYTAKVLGSDAPICGAAFTAKTGIGSHQATIKTYPNPYYVPYTKPAGTALLFMGYNETDTAKAMDYVLALHPSIGSETQICLSTASAVATQITCPTTPTQITCRDSDGGEMLNVKGNCYDSNGIHTDFCIDNNKLLEYYCAPATGTCWNVTYDCILNGYSGCSDGACIQAPQISASGGLTKEVPIGASLNSKFGSFLTGSDIPGFFLNDNLVTINTRTYNSTEELFFVSDSPSITTGLAQGSTAKEWGKDIWMTISSSGKVSYKYIFKSALNPSDYITSASQDNPIDITFLGKNLKITGATASSINISGSKYKDGDAYIGQDLDNPDWIWYLANLDTATPTIGVKNAKVYLTPSGTNKPIKTGESLSGPDNYFAISLGNSMITSYKDYTFNGLAVADLYRTDNTLMQSAVNGLEITASDGQQNGFLTSDGKYTDKLFLVAIAQNHTFYKLGFSAANPDQGMHYQEIGGGSIGPGGSRQFAVILNGDTSVPLTAESSADGKSVKVIIDGQQKITQKITLSNGQIKFLGIQLGTAAIGDLYVDSTDISIVDADGRTKDGIIINSIKANGDSDQLKISVPPKIGDDFTIPVTISGPSGIIAPTTIGANYPAPFSTSGSTSVVIGANAPESDLVAAIAIATDLAGANAGPHVVFDTDMTTADKAVDLIVVGNSCDNSAAAKILGSDVPKCGAEFTALTNVGANQAIIKIVGNPYASGKIAMLVAGYETADTAKAVSYVISNKPSTAVGTQICLSTSAELATQVACGGVQPPTGTCIENDVRNYECPGGTQVQWCTCINSAWQCIQSPEALCAAALGCQGCFIDETTCKPVGSRFKYNWGPEEAPNIEDSYCGGIDTIRLQRTDGSSCEDNYKCLSNYCDKGVCVNIEAKVNLLIKMICTLLHPIDDENYKECLVSFA